MKLNFFSHIKINFNLELRTVLLTWMLTVQFCSMRTFLFNVNVIMDCSVF